MSTSTKELPRLKQRYNDEFRVQLKDSLGLGNIMQVPRLEKIVINMGVGLATDQAKLLEGATRRPRDHQRPEAPHTPGQEVDRRLQAA
jgi:large subunit ribosomal protein L5